MTDDKKKDGVISLEDFKKTAEKLDGKEDEVPSIQEVADAMLKHDLKEFVGIGVTEQGQIAFYTTTSDYGEILFLCEVYKKLIMEGVTF